MLHFSVRLHLYCSAVIDLRYRFAYTSCKAPLWYYDKQWTFDNACALSKQRLQYDCFTFVHDNAAMLTLENTLLTGGIYLEFSVHLNLPTNCLRVNDYRPFMFILTKSAQTNTMSFNFQHNLNLKNDR